MKDEQSKYLLKTKRLSQFYRTCAFLCLLGIVSGFWISPERQYEILHFSAMGFVLAGGFSLMYQITSFGIKKGWWE